jgi:hypothetical protein
MRRQDLDVLDVASAVGREIFDLKVRELDATIDIREVVLLCPGAHFVGISSGPAVAVAATPVRLLEENLILALEVVFEDNTLDMRAFLGQAFCRTKVSSVQLRVVGKFTGTGKTVVEDLDGLVVV